MAPVQDQASCGSCVAFGTNATIEGSIVKAGGKLNKLSEWDLFSHGGSCSEGWTLEAANEAAKTYGVCPDVCWPYTGTRQPCPTDPNHKTKILGSDRITSDAEAKEWLLNKGPINAAMDVYSDFYSINSDAVYKSNEDDRTWQGGHCVSLVGFSDIDNCWIVRNSWGKNWGADGYFRIAYGNCNILRGYAVYGEIVPTQSPYPVETHDITLPNDCTLQIMPIIGLKTYMLKVGDAALVSFRLLNNLQFNTIGTFLAGGYNLTLKNSKGEYHFVTINGTYPEWRVYMGTSPTKFNIAFILRAI